MSKIVNLGDPMTHRLTLRLTDKQFDFLTKAATLMGTTPSDYLRMVVNASMISTSRALDTMMKGEVGMSNENIKTNQYDIV